MSKVIELIKENGAAAVGAVGLIISAADGFSPASVVLLGISAAGFSLKAAFNKETASSVFWGLLSAAFITASAIETVNGVQPLENFTPQDLFEDVFPASVTNSP